MTRTRQRASGPPEGELVARYSRLIGELFGLVRVLPGGRAIQVERTDGAGFVLKWDTDLGSRQRRREATVVAEKLGRSAGWPVPTFTLAEDDGHLFVRQSLMPGAELAHLTTPVVDRVVELIDATAGLGRGLDSNWPHRLVDTLIAEPIEPQSYVDHEPLRRHSAAGQALIARIEDIGASLDPRDLGPAGDLMHWDLHPGNVLVDGETVTAIIDLDNASPGPRSFDLTTFALSSQVITGGAGAHRRLMDMARERVSERCWAASVAHLVLRFANWGLRTGHLDEAEFWIDEGLRHLDE